MYHVLVLVLCLSARGLAGYSQFFYAGHSGPVQQGYYQPVQQYQTPVAYQSFVPQQHYVSQAPQVQTYSAFPAYPTPHSFGYHQSIPQQFIYHTSNAVQAQSPEAIPPSPSAATSSNATENAGAPAPVNEDPIPATAPAYDDSVVTSATLRSSNPQNHPAPTQPDNFRGFAYSNEFESGRSHFVFITGPEAYRMSHPQAERPVSSRTSASDAVDSVASPSAGSNDHSLDALVQYLAHPQVGLQRFYSVNNALVSRRVEDDIPSLPAPPAPKFSNVGTTLPITQPISPLLPILRSSFQLDVETVKPAEKQTNAENKEEQVESASNIETESVAPETSADSTSTTTSEPSTTVTTTTEVEKVTIAPAATFTTTEKTESSTAEEKSTMETIVVE